MQNIGLYCGAQGERLWSPSVKNLVCVANATGQQPLGPSLRQLWLSLHRGWCFFFREIGHLHRGRTSKEALKRSCRQPHTDPHTHTETDYRCSASPTKSAEVYFVAICRDHSRLTDYNGADGKYSIFAAEQRASFN